MSAPTDALVREIARKLIPMERERLTEWQGVGGAAYNAISEDLCGAGLLNANWSLSALGLLVRHHLLNQDQPS